MSSRIDETGRVCADKTASRILIENMMYFRGVMPLLNKKLIMPRTSSRCVYHWCTVRVAAMIPFVCLLACFVLLECIRIQRIRRKTTDATLMLDVGFDLNFEFFGELRHPLPAAKPQTPNQNQLLQTMNNGGCGRRW